VEPDGQATDALTALRITAPDGASAFFNSTTSQLVVRNTAANLELVQTLLEQNRNASLGLAVSVEIYALKNTEALGLMSEHGADPDVSEVVSTLRARVDGKSVRLVATPYSITRSGQAVSIESGETIDYVAGYVERSGRDEPVSRTAFAGTKVKIEPIMGADKITIDARIEVAIALGKPEIETRKVIAPVSGKEAAVSSIRLDQLTLKTVTTTLAGQTKLVGIMNPPAHLGSAEAHVVFLKITSVKKRAN
jgi:hypothetical protein